MPDAEAKHRKGVNVSYIFKFKTLHTACLSQAS
jgi:hypothetical protein